jgi:hypothetical protein
MSIHSLSTLQHNQLRVHLLSGLAEPESGLVKRCVHDDTVDPDTTAPTAEGGVVRIQSMQHNSMIPTRGLGSCVQDVGLL